MTTWNNGDTYNLLNTTVSADVAKKAQAAGYKGYFGAQDGEEFKTAFYQIVNSLQYGLLVRAAHAGGIDPSVIINGKDYVPKK